MNKKWIVIAASGALLVTSSIAMARTSSPYAAQPGHAAEHQDQDQRRGSDQNRHENEHDRREHHDRRGHHDRNRDGRYREYSNVRHDRGRREGWYHTGGRLPRAYRGSRYVVNDWRGEHLRAPPRGYRWHRSDNGDFLLVAISTGIITQILLNH
ncbi:RcnB family protein [Oleiagrimonas sp.]|jgi:Ni/Co efflux regulator RcnB|uniref:RcnB family protein n=1 Tax=Oleiagrimonas sp. TaxID=2010330 RepID=UPI00260A21C4|nr:RcnB family protein [Oleiagrimonas sp.]MDA3913716.1 RcnB family protein [Oleiagrimonas sp.]